MSWAPGNTDWAFSSDRTAKENFTPVSPQDVLDRVAQLPITEWNFKGYSQRHIGPTAQDFHKQFPLNTNDTQIDGGDLHGVTLAAIKGLNQKLESRIQQQDAEIRELKALVQQLLARKGHEPE